MHGCINLLCRSINFLTIYSLWEREHLFRNQHINYQSRSYRTISKIPTQTWPIKHESLIIYIFSIKNFRIKIMFWYFILFSIFFNKKIFYHRKNTEFFFKDTTHLRSTLCTSFYCWRIKENLQTNFHFLRKNKSS